MPGEIHQEEVQRLVACGAQLIEVLPAGTMERSISLEQSIFR
jgi:hypothetical protein